jgi:hypothetical protein
MLNFLLKLVGLDLLLRIARGGIRGLGHPIFGALTPLWRFLSLIALCYITTWFLHPALAWQFFVQHVAFPLGIVCLIASAVTWSRRHRIGNPSDQVRGPPPVVRALRRSSLSSISRPRKHRNQWKRTPKNYFPWETHGDDLPEDL